jgi:hypothetical protein
MEPIFVDLRSDFGFKKFIHNETFALAFINSILPEEIESMERLTTRSLSSSRNVSEEQLDKRQRRSSEQLAGNNEFELEVHEVRGVNEDEKSVIFDFVCKTKKGDFINVEMQRAQQIFYVHRALFYTSRLMSRQGYKGKDSSNKPWSWKISRHYHVGILDFDFEEVDQLPRKCAEKWKVWLQLGINSARTEPQEPTFTDNEVFSPDLLHICLISLTQFQKLFSNVDLSSKPSLYRFFWLFSKLSGCSEGALPEWAKSGLFLDIMNSMKRAKLSQVELQKYEAELLKLRNEGETEYTKLLKRDLQTYIDLVEEIGEESAVKFCVKRFGEDYTSEIITFAAKHRQ